MATLWTSLWWWLVVCAGALPWYLNMQLLALVALPLVFGVCTRLHDRGYALAKAMGLVLVTYFSWLLAHGVLPFGHFSVVVGLGVLAAMSALALGMSWRELVAFLAARWRVVLAMEGVFLAAFLAMVTLRAHVPQITYVIGDAAAEKFTDFAILNSLLASPVFPPHDAWVSGAPLNYYYFGHLMWATLVKLAGIPAAVGFNLALASIFALVCVQGFSLGYNLTRRARYGMLAMFLVAVAGNLDGFLQWVGLVAGHGLDPAEWARRFDYWRPSRAVENTITEFPAFSLVLGDLHAHLSGLVIFLAGLLLAVQIFRGLRGQGSLLAYEMRNPGELFLAALLSGAMYAANSWDAITFAAVMAMVLWAGRDAPCDAAPRARVTGRPRRAAWRLAQAAEALLLSGVLTFVGTQLLFRPFSRLFRSPLPFRLPEGFPLRWEGIVLPLKPVAETNRTAPAEFAAHWLLLVGVPAVLALALAWRAGRGTPSPVTGRRAAPGEVFWGLAALAAAAVAVMWSGGTGLVGALLAVSAAALAGTLLAARLAPGLRLLLGVLMVFAVLALFCEVLHLDDIFGDGGDVAIERINTVFKIYYGLWPLAVAAFVLGLHRAVRWAPQAVRRRRAWMLVAPVVLAGAAYPLLAPFARVAQVAPDPAGRAPAAEALDGTRYLIARHPGDYAVIQYVLHKTDPEARLLEAVGTQYQYSGRISTNTGRPALGGWLYHAWAWRGDGFFDERERRIRTARRVYETRSAHEALETLRTDRIDFVVVGDQERAVYPALDEAKFALIARPVFSMAGTTLYEVDYDTDVTALPPPPAPPAPAADIPPQYRDRTVRISDDIEPTTAPAATDGATTAP